ncbi:Zinc finger protein, partial [Ophiophagus hannah]
MEKGLEGPGRVPRIVQVMYFKGVPRQPNQQPEAGLTQQWEAQWQEFLNTLQPAHAGWGNLQLTDMAPWDDARAFLMAFEQVAEACQWPREEWVRQLLPALRGGMEQSFCRLDARDRTDYVKVKAAILRADAFRMEMKRQHFRHEMTPTRNSVLAHPSSSAGLEMAETGTPEGPVHVKDELGLDQKPIHWEVMRGSGSSSSALEGLLVPTPEVNSQTDQPQATFQERPVQADQIPDFGGRIIGEIKIETFQQAISEAEEDFDTLQGEESSGATSLSSESSPLDPEKRLGARQQGEVQKKKCTRRRRRAFHKKNKYYPTEKKHTCPECGHKSYFYSDLLRHMKTHAVKELLKCLECGKTYRGRSYFENHQKIHLPLDDNNRRASEHRNTTMHACTKCGYQAEKLSDILKHFRVHNKEKPYRYLDCGNSFGWSSTLMRHQQTHIANQQTPKPPGRQEAGLQNGPKRSSKRSPAAAPPSSAASRLEASSLPFRSRERNGKGQAAPHRKKVKKNRYEGLEKKHLCLDCGHRTYYLSDLMRHKRAHPNGKPYKCPDCEKIFAQPSFLKLHLKTHKPGKKPMKRLKAPQGERKYTCSKCGHKTYKLSTLLLHTRAHAGERETSYICDECGKDFKRSSNLSRHKRIHSLNNEGFRIRRPSFTHDKEINR